MRPGRGASQTTEGELTDTPLPPAAYTTGYAGQRPEDLLVLAELLEATVIDIRYAARSMRPQWRRQALAGLLGDRYRHVRTLGNVNYREPAAGIVIADPEAGLADVLSERRAVILLCGCGEAETCHRRVVARLLEGRGLTAEEIGDWAEAVRSRAAA
jgi:uncharacterized protein (DUF488 family)